LIAQLAFTASDVPQLFVCAKSPLPDVTPMLVTFMDHWPVLVSVTGNAPDATPTCWPPNARPAGESDAIGGATPVPDKLTVADAFEPLDAMVSVPEAVPVGWGCTSPDTVQLPLLASADEQVFVAANGAPAVAPLTRSTCPFPVFVTVIVWAALVVPTPWFANVRVVADRLAIPMMPVPERLTVCGLPAALSVMVSVRCASRSSTASASR